MKKLILTSSVVLGSALLAGCGGGSGKGQDQLVECYGVGKQGPDVPVMMTKGICDKLPSTKQVPVTANDYVECYGVAAAGKNDCATSASACGGTASIDRAANAWIAIPRGVCESLKGSVVGQLGTKDAKKAAPSQS